MHLWIHSIYLGIVTVATLLAVVLAGRRAWQLRLAAQRPRPDRALNELIWTLLPLLLLLVLACRAWFAPAGW